MGYMSRERATRLLRHCRRVTFLVGGSEEWEVADEGKLLRGEEERVYREAFKKMTDREMTAEELAKILEAHRPLGVRQAPKYEGGEHGVRGEAGPEV